MAHLFSRHDFLHLHALVGALALIHFFYRFLLVIRYGTSFPLSESLWFQTGCVLLHAALPLLSLQFPLPPKRNYTKPMIWPEFRLHSLTFATRHVVATLMDLWGLWPTSNLIAEILAKTCLVVFTIQAASYVSRKYGDPDRRTTNAMPYPSCLDDENQYIIKQFYARAQFGATAACLVDLATTSFWPLVAIQGAAFLMTLVRKGYLSALGYHKIYTLSLVMNLWVVTAIVCHRGLNGKAIWFILIVQVLIRDKWRFQYQWSAEFCWILGVALLLGSWRLFVEKYLDQPSVVPHSVWVSLHALGCIPISAFAGGIPLNLAGLFPDLLFTFLIPKIRSKIRAYSKKV